MPRTSIAIPVADPSGVGEARRAATAVARRMGFDETHTGRVALVATEAANNLLRHGGGGELLVRPLDRHPPPAAGVEVLAVDRGPGIADVGRALRDGYSTGDTHGTGLGAIARLSTEFDVHSSVVAPAGTVVLARVWNAAVAPDPVGGIEVGVVCVPKPGEAACGDGWRVIVGGDPDRMVAMVVDGLGHGVHAAEAARQAARLLHENAGLPPVPLVQALHAGMRGTRGAAVAVAELTPGRASFCGVGNVAVRLLTPGGEARHWVSHNGTVGAELRRVQAFDYPVPDDATMVMHTDGVSSSWRAEAHPGLMARHPGVIAGVLYRDGRRVRDDATVLVLRRSQARPATTTQP